MGNVVTTVRLSQVAVETVNNGRERISTLVRIASPSLTTACRQAGLPIELAELCGGLLASVVDDLVAASGLPRRNFERTRRLQRVLAAADEPAASALRIAMAASPINGKAAVAHYDVVCEPHEVGKLAWLLGADTETAYRYGRQRERRR